MASVEGLCLELPAVSNWRFDHRQSKHLSTHLSPAHARSAAIGRGCFHAEWSKLPDALRVRKVHIGLQIRQSWPAVPVSDSKMKRKARSDTEVARKPPAARQVPNPPGIDYREHPELYKVARGEQGVLTVEPYKSEILPHWRFRYMYDV